MQSTPAFLSQLNVFFNLPLKGKLLCQFLALVCFIRKTLSLPALLPWVFWGFFLFFGGRAHLQHMEVPRQGVELELQLLAYATATAMPDLSHVCNLHHSSQQRWILNPPSEARDQTHVLMILVRLISSSPQGELPPWTLEISRGHFSSILTQII